MSEEHLPARDWSKATPAERADEAARMRTSGYEYREIARELGYANHTGAYKAVQRALVDAADKRAEPLDVLRMMETARIDRMIKRALEVMERRHYVTNNAGVVFRPTEFLRDAEGAIAMDDKGNYKALAAEPLQDDGPTLDAIRTVVTLMQRKAKMHGLDAPSRREVITLDSIEAEIARLEAAANA